MRFFLRPSTLRSVANSVRSLAVFGLIFVGQNVQAQNSMPTPKQELLARLEIQRATVNQKEVSSKYLARQHYFAFYRDETGQLSLANVCGTCQDQSYGTLEWLGSEVKPATRKQYRTVVTRYKWHYANTYDQASGSALLVLTRTYTEQGVAFSMRSVLLSNLETSEFRGSVAGTVDFPTRKSASPRASRPLSLSAVLLH